MEVNNTTWNTEDSCEGILDASSLGMGEKQIEETKLRKTSRRVLGWHFYMLCRNLDAKSIWMF